MSFFDLQIPFFIPVWRRIILISVCLMWAVFECYAGAYVWGILFVGLGGLAAWQLFFSGWPKANEHSSR